MQTKKLLAILIAAVMVFALLPASLFAATITASNATELANKITAAAAGDTIKLTANITGIAEMSISKKITIDMNGFNISGNPTSYTAFKVASGGDLTLSNTGTQQARLLVGIGDANEAFYEGIRITAGGKATVGTNVSIETGCAVVIIGNGTENSAELNVYGKLVVTADYYDTTRGRREAFAAIQGSGNAGKGGTLINIYEGAEILNTFSSAMYCPQNGVVNILGGTIVGKASAIGIKGGTLNISGGTLRATGPLDIPTAGWSNGINASGCAIQIESNADYDNITVNITGGSIISLNGYAVYEYLASNTTTTKVNEIYANAPAVLWGKAGTALVSADLQSQPKVNIHEAAVGHGDAANSEVTSDVDITYTIIIPSKVDFGTLARGTGIKEKPFTVSATGVVIENGKNISVAVTSTFTMTGNKGGTIPYELYQGTTKITTGTFATFTAGTPEQRSIGKVTVDTTGIQYAGDYSGIMTFAISYVG